MRALALAFVFLGACGAASSPPSERAPTPMHWTALASPTNESLRGLAVVSARVVWASGAHGTFVRSTDGGATWSSGVVPGADALDFRSVHAFDADHAVVLSAGSPARAFVTRDAGATWAQTYANDDPAIFFDSLAFEGDEGLALGDPMPGREGARFALLITHDAGDHWEMREGPIAEAGEAAFAASNGCVAIAPGLALFATGGSVARVFRSIDEAATWSSVTMTIAPGSAAQQPMIASGAPSRGIFAVALRDARIAYAVGGDYAEPASPGGFARSIDGGVHWQTSALRGFRSSIAILADALVVVGTSGSDLSRDEGASWTAIDDTPLNAVRVAEGVAFSVGPEGRIVRLDR